MAKNMSFMIYLKETFKYLLRCPLVISKYIKQVENLYTLSHDELHSYGEERFLKIFRKAWDKSSFYQQLCRLKGIGRNDIQHLEDIKRLPVLTKDMLKAHGTYLLTQCNLGLIKSHTSGTTGTPLTVYKDWPALWREQAYLYCYRKRCGYTYGEPLVSLRGNLSKAQLSLKVHVSNTLYLSSYNININTATRYFQLIKKHHPKAIEGYPSSLYSLALVFREKQLECHIPLAFTSSENLYDYQRDLIEKTFHTQVFDHYGATERTISLEEDFNHDGYFESPGYGIEEYYDDYIITTSLINDVFPLIRYRIEDRVVLKSDARSNEGDLVLGQGVKSLNGRAASFLVGKDGTMYGDASLTFIFRDTPEVQFAQFIQEKPGRVILNIVVGQSFDQDSRDRLLSNIDKKMGLSNMNVEIHEVDRQQLKYSSRGKLALIVSDVPLLTTVRNP